MRSIHRSIVAVVAAAVTATASAASPKQAVALDAHGRSVYLVALSDPPAATFERIGQIGNGKSAGYLEPTATSVTGLRKFDAKSASAKRYIGFLHDRQNEVLAAAGARVGRLLTPKFRYDLVANGFAIALTQAEAEAFKAVHGVASIRPDTIQQPLTDASAAWIGANAIWNGTVQGSNIQTRGEGVVVGIIDTGITAWHPAFQDVAQDGFNHSNARGQRYGVCASGFESLCNDKLIGVYDYYNTACTYLTDSPPGADCFGHGSHVASTAAGNPFNVIVTAPTTTLQRIVSGMAPRANLIAYKVCGETREQGCPVSNTIAALNQAVADAVDVVNFSVSSVATDPWAGFRAGTIDVAAAFLNARAAGIVPVVAAGNDGPGAATLYSVASSPWVLSTGAVSAGRKLTTTLAGITGHGVGTPFNLEGAGITSGIATAQIVHGKDFGSALCGTGASVPLTSCSNSASKPFAPGSLAGKIVICDRGIYDRIEKGCNVKLAGAVGMIVANVPSGEGNVVADAHFLPATHLDTSASATIRNLVEAARVAGGQISAAISPVTTSTGGSGVIAGFSSRGPVSTYAGVLKPDFAAPGVDITAAANRTVGEMTISGTSMASPHAAGAAALLLAGNPSWTVAQVQSALVGTASNSVLLEDGTTAAAYFDAGAGSVRVDAAARAGLHFNVTTTQLQAADPQAGGDPKSLNLGSVHSDNCFERCTFTRTVTANVAGTWRVETVAQAGAAITVAPTEFSLAAGAARALDITVDVSATHLTTHWVAGNIKLIPVDANVATTVLPVSVLASPGQVPEEFVIETDTTNGFRDIEIADLAAMADLTFSNTTLVAAQRHDRAIALDATESAPFDLLQGTYTAMIGPSEAGWNVDGVLIATTSAAAGSDIDLFVGFDADRDGIAELSEVLCTSGSPNSAERCEIDTDFPSPQDRYWVHVQRYAGPADETIGIETVHVPDGGAGNTRLSITGPRVLDRVLPFKARVAWNAPWLELGKNAYAFAYLGTTRSEVGNLGRVLVRIKRTANTTPAPIVLNGKFDTEIITLAAGVAHERIVIDVPPNATGLHLATGGSGEIDLYLAKATDPVTPPTFAAAPARALAAGSSNQVGASEAIDLLAPALTPGRWYVTPVNTGTTEATFTLVAKTDFAAGSVRPVMQSYFNPNRSGHGMFLSQVGNIWALVWYTYLEDGTPVWYYAQADGPTGNDGVWRVPLSRYTWNGSVPHFDTVGEIIMTFNSASSFTFSWLVNGRYGSEPFQTVTPLSCPNIGGSLGLYSGGWYQPGNGGWGFSVNALSFADAEAAYIFDAKGTPRWLLGSSAPAASVTIPLLQYAGFCPTCARTAAPTTASVGTMTRSYATNSTGNLDINVDFADPVPGTWIKTGVQGKLTPDMACQ